MADKKIERGYIIEKRLRSTYIEYTILKRNKYGSRAIGSRPLLYMVWHCSDLFMTDKVDKLRGDNRVNDCE